MRKIFAILLCVSNILTFFSCGLWKNVQESITRRVVFQNEPSILFLQGGENSFQLKTAVYDNDLAIEDAKIVYTVEKSNIAEVGEDGRIIAKNIGITKVHATYKKAKATTEVRVVDIATAEQVNTFDEKYVNLYGRTYQNENG